MVNFCLSNQDDVLFLTEVLFILSEPNRLKILCLLNSYKKLCVCEIVWYLWLKQNLVSHHVSIMKKIWLLDREKLWLRVYYSINMVKYNKIKTILQKTFNI